MSTQSLAHHSLTNGHGGDPGDGYEYVCPGVVVPVHGILDGRRHGVIPETFACKLTIM